MAVLTKNEAVFAKRDGLGAHGPFERVRSRRCEAERRTNHRSFACLIRFALAPAALDAVVGRRRRSGLLGPP